MATSPGLRYACDVERSRFTTQLAATLVGCALVVGCVDTDFAEGQFLCGPAASGDVCPDGMFCAADGRCRSVAVVGTGGTSGLGGSAGSGGDAGAGGTAGSGGSAGNGGAGGGGSCDPDWQMRTANRVTQTDVGTYVNPWELLDAMTALDSNATTTVSAIEDARSSDNLELNDFGFNLPTGAEVLGIEFSLWRRRSGPGILRDQVVRLVTSEATTDSFPGPGTWPDTKTKYTHGSENQLWNYTWTAELINDDAFGIRMVVISDAGNGDAARPYIDYLEMTVHFLPPCAGGG